MPKQNKGGLQQPLFHATFTEYVLYHVNQLHNTSIFARLAYDLPGEICCFLQPALYPENHFKKFPKGGV